MKVFVDLSPDWLVVSDGSTILLREKTSGLVNLARPGTRQASWFTELGRTVRKAAGLSWWCSRPRVLVIIDPEVTADDKRALFRALGAWASEVLVIDRFLATCAGIEAIAQSELRTAVGYVLGGRGFVTTFFCNAMLNTRRITFEPPIDPEAVVDAAKALTAETGEFPWDSADAARQTAETGKSPLGHLLSAADRDRLRLRWNQGWNQTVHLIVEREGFGPEERPEAEASLSRRAFADAAQGAQPSQLSLHVSGPAGSFALAGLITINGQGIRFPDPPMLA